MRNSPMQKYRYSEIFSSAQFEGHYTGIPTVWVRWFLCNLTCSGFGQTDPTDSSSYDLPYKDFDLVNVKQIQDLPVWTKGCDSSYSWAKRFKHLCPESTVSEIATALETLMSNEYNTAGKFENGVKNRHLCMTGGEPMLKNNQQAMIELIDEFIYRDNFPRQVTVETNGTQPLSQDLCQLIENSYRDRAEWFWSVSPKLFTVSGESRNRAIKPEVVASYQQASKAGQLKFVVRNSPDSWDELEQLVSLFREAGVTWPVWIMPVGATDHSQSTDDTREIVEETITRGYNVSARVHAYIWDNVIGK